MARIARATRESSATSTKSSASSCIIVGGSRESLSCTDASSTTWPTSTSDSLDCNADVEKLALLVQRRRLTRISTSLSNSAMLESSEEASRAISGETLVERANRVNQSPLTTTDKSTDKKKYSDSGSVISLKGIDSNGKRRSGRLSHAVRSTGDLLSSTASSLGKRGKDALETGLQRMDSLKSNKRDTLRLRVDEREELQDEPQKKRSRLSKVMSSFNALGNKEDKQLVIKPQQSSKGKRWLSAGLYVGQSRDFDARFNPKLTAQRKKNKGHREGVPEKPKENSALQLPMFAGKRLLENGRNFKLPFDVFYPLPKGQPKPDEWSKTQKNLFVGDAAGEWKHHKPLPPSRCVCTPEFGCDEDCQNRYMLYECDDANCNVGREACSNRAFADLKDRVKSGNKYDIGVEVLKTAEKGFGVRSNRTFEPNQIIVEYAGEIITQDECERRMRKEYKNNECYYLMMFDQNMIIDATRGSIARFVNHSCEPNCRMVKWTVAGKPRMALFAGDKGIMTGEELTYDYNFDPFSQKNVQICCCGSPSCRGVLGPRASERPPKPTDGIVAGAKRKIQEVLSSSNSQSRKKAEVKKPRTSALITKASAGKQRRVTSSSSTLVEKENLLPVGKLRDSSSSSSGSSRKVTQTHRRRTVDSLSRVSSLIKRNASLVRSRTAVRHQSKTVTQTREVPALYEPLELDLTTERATMHQQERKSTDPLFPIFESRTAGNRPMTAASVKSAAASMRRGVVKSVRGPRRAAATAKVGLLGEGSELGVMRKTVRVISGEEPPRA